MSDGEIIARVRAGETGAFADLVRRHQDRVYGMALRTTGRPEDAEDLAQDVFLSVFRGLAAFKGDAQFTTWLYRIAWNRCADWLRRNRKPGRRTTQLEAADDIADGRADPAAAVLGEDDRVRLRRALERGSVAAIEPAHFLLEVAAALDRAVRDRRIEFRLTPEMMEEELPQPGFWKERFSDLPELRLPVTDKTEAIIEALQTVEYEGVTGTFSFASAADGPVARGDVVVAGLTPANVPRYIMKDGEFVSAQ